MAVAVARPRYQKLFGELSLALVLLDNHPHYNLTTLQSQEAFDLWKSRETKEILELMRQIDKDEYEVGWNAAAAACSRTFLSAVGPRFPGASEGNAGRAT